MQHPAQRPVGEGKCIYHPQAKSIKSWVFHNAHAYRNTMPHATHVYKLCHLERKTLTGAEEMAQLAKRLSHKRVDVSSNPKHVKKKKRAGKDGAHL